MSDRARGAADPDGDEILGARDLVVQLGGREVLNVPTLGVRRGEILSVVGPNGAGKSTLLRALALLEAPTGGSIVFDGRTVRPEPRELLALRRRMATVFQSPLLCDASVFDNIGLGLRFRGASGARVRQLVCRWAATFGIAHLLDRPARGLSGGEAQRASLARAFALEPDVLFLDEPFAALDAPTREAVLGDLETVLRDSHTSTVFVTHNRDEALQLGDRVAVMVQGRLVQMDTPQRVFRAPVSEGVARFLGVDNVVRGIVRERHDDLATVIAEGVEMRIACNAEPGQPVVVCLRPEDVALLAAGSEGPARTRENVLPGRVRRAVPRGGQLRVQVDAGLALTVLISERAWQDLAAAQATEVQVVFGVTAPHVIPDDGSSGRPPLVNGWPP